LPHCALILAVISVAIQPLSKYFFQQYG